MKNRKGARKVQDIPKGVLIALNKGSMETVNLTEWLGIDHTEIVKNTFPKLGLKTYVQDVSAGIQALKKPTAMSSTKVVGNVLYQACVKDDQLDHAIEQLAGHTSDTLRCYATYLIALDEKARLKAKLDRAMPLVADSHFGVREVVWMALRPSIEGELDLAIKILTQWTKEDDENIRRFTTEATRPRGVWCKHIDALKENPALALPILEPLRTDSSKYVQDSVGNWLNDASKTQPQFVQDLCNRWTMESASKATAKIVKRALRTIQKG